MCKNNNGKFDDIAPTKGLTVKQGKDGPYLEMDIYFLNELITCMERLIEPDPPKDLDDYR